MYNMHNLPTTFLCQTNDSPKVKKLVKNLLTNGGRSAIICKLSDSWAVNERSPRAVNRKTAPKENHEKKLKKLLKNLLTNARECDIIVGHFSPNGKRVDERAFKESRKIF